MNDKKVRLWTENYDKIKELLPPRMTMTYWVNKCIEDSIEAMQVEKAKHE